VIWRAFIVAAYIALAIVIGIAYGLSGLTVLSFYYLWAGFWVVFALVWGRAARRAGRWNVERPEAQPAHSEADRPRPGNGEPEPVVRDDAPAAKRRRPVLAS